MQFLGQFLVQINIDDIDAARSRMQGTCQIAFLVFTRCRNGLLLPERRPEEADFGVEVDVGECQASCRVGFMQPL